MSNRDEFLKRIRQENKDLEEFTNLFKHWGKSICDTPIEEIERLETEYVRSQCSDEFNEMIDKVFEKYNTTTDKVTSQDEER